MDASRQNIVGLAYHIQAYPADDGTRTVGCGLTALPLLLFLLVMNQFIEGLTAGAIKL